MYFKCFPLTYLQEVHGSSGRLLSRPHLYSQVRDTSCYEVCYRLSIDQWRVVKIHIRPGRAEPPMWLIFNILLFTVSNEPNKYFVLWRTQTEKNTFQPLCCLVAVYYLLLVTFRAIDFNHVTRFTFSHLRGEINREKLQ